MYGCVALLWGEFSRNGSDRNAIVLRRVGGRFLSRVPFALKHVYVRLGHFTLPLYLISH